MKLALIVPGGVDRSGTHRVIPQLLWLIERLARVHDVHVFALRQEPRPSVYRLHGATVHNIGRRPRRVFTLTTLVREHMRGRFDALHAFWAAPQGVIAGTAGRMLNVPVLLNLMGGDLTAISEIEYGALRHPQGNAWLRVALAGATHVTVESAAMQRRAAGLGIDAERLPHGIALDHWPLREPRALVHSPARLLHVGSLNLVKDPFTLLRAVARVRERMPVLLDLVGVDTLEGRVQVECDRLGLREIVRFHGFVPHHQLRPFFERADALVVASRHESGPMAALEAAVTGVPVVGTAVGHLQEWAPYAAIAVPTARPLELGDAIVALLSDDSRRVALARAAQARALHEDADAAAARHHAIYSKLQDLRRLASVSA